MLSRKLESMIHCGWIGREPGHMLPADTRRRRHVRRGGGAVRPPLATDAEHGGGGGEIV